MQITVNNQSVVLSDLKTNIPMLLQQQGVQPSGTAVVLNGRLITKTKWDGCILREGDDVILISAAFGG
ncbi:MAG: sulfur carrier protein ThiS [Muribaculaceae bacterium]|nr:sulfur carrier protein ThiS [Muribaculaceae bacterium]